MSRSDYITALNPKGYVNNREFTNLDGQYLVKGSKNTLIFQNERIDSRKGMTRIGQEKTRNKATTGKFDWYNSAGKWLNTRVVDRTLELWYKNDFIPLKTGLYSDISSFCTWWDSNEIVDQLLFVDGSSQMYSWNGAVTEVFEVTANTISKYQYITNSTIGFVNNVGSADQITTLTGDFVAQGFFKGQKIRVSGSSSNDGVYTVDSVAALVIGLSDEDTLTNEGIGSSITITDDETGTFAESRFNLTGDKKIMIDGVVYEYTGGEGTGTLTGVTPDPTGAVSAGDVITQSVIEHSPAKLNGYFATAIGMVNNYVFVGSETSRETFMSKDNDFADFTYTSPLRLVGEGFEFLFDSPATAFVPNESEMWVTGGIDDWYQVTFELTADHAGESVRIRKFKTSTGQAAINENSIVSGKNGVAFITQAKDFDFLGKVNAETGYNTKPLSDPIKLDMEQYNFKGANGLYFQRNTYLSLPEENIVLVYDNERNYWQPPQTYPISLLALIDIEGDGNVSLCGYSNNSDEVYKLFDGASDNGAKYTCTAAFGYDNFGARFDLKNFDELATELYISANTEVTRTVLLDYLGSSGKDEYLIRGNDPATTFGVSGSSALGIAPFGVSPSGSSVDTITNIKKCRIIHTTVAKDFFERQNIFESDSDGVQFSILAYAENVHMSENEPTFIRK